MYNSFELFFFWRKCGTVVAVGVQTSFLLFCKKCDRKKTTAGWIVRRPTKRPCKPRLDRLGDRCFDKLSSRQAQRSVKSADLEIRGGDFCRLGIVPAELHVINIQVKPSALNCSLKILIHWQ